MFLIGAFRAKSVHAPRIDLSSSHCFRFFYHARHSVKQGFVVFVHELKVGKWVEIWRRENYVGPDMWLLGQFDIGPGNIDIVFMTYDQGVTAIDDTMLLPGTCATQSQILSFFVPTYKQCDLLIFNYPFPCMSLCKPAIFKYSFQCLSVCQTTIFYFSFPCLSVCQTTIISYFFPCMSVCQTTIFDFSFPCLPVCQTTILDFSIPCLPVCQITIFSYTFPCLSVCQTMIL